MLLNDSVACQKTSRSIALIHDVMFLDTKKTREMRTEKRLALEEEAVGSGTKIGIGEIEPCLACTSSERTPSRLPGSRRKKNVPFSILQSPAKFVIGRSISHFFVYPTRFMIRACYAFRLVYCIFGNVLGKAGGVQAATALDGLVP